jgi:hypothetical protein
MSGVRYSVSEVIRKVLEDTDDDFSAISSDSDDSVSDQDHVSEAEAVESSSSDESDFEPVVPVTRGRGRGRCRGRGRGVASRGRGISTCSRGRPVHNVVDSTGETAADFQKSDEMKAKSGKMWSKNSTCRASQGDHRTLFAHRWVYAMKHVPKMNWTFIDILIFCVSNSISDTS